MEILNNFKILQSVVILLIAIFFKIIASRSLRNIKNKFNFQINRIVIINKIVTFVTYTTALVIIAFIWGVKEEELLLFVSSFLTILGIAFFAQWSILSNITAGLILFINYPVKIGDTITVLEKDNNISGEILNIGAFFMSIKTSDNQFITMPNSTILQKMVQYKDTTK